MEKEVDCECQIELQFIGLEFLFFAFNYNEKCSVNKDVIYSVYKYLARCFCVVF